MIEDVAAAFEQKNYQKAAQLLKPLLRQFPNDPWVRLYSAMLNEANGKPDVAEAVYRSLLRDVLNPKVALQARQGLIRLEVAERENRQQAIAQAEERAGHLGNSGSGFLVLEPIHGDARKTAAQGLARIMKLDPYTAQLQLPSRGWRLYRTGTIGELQVYGEELRNSGIPAFWVALSQIRKIRMFRVQYIQTTSPQPTVVCQNESGHLGTLTFDWSDVSQQVRALLPIFENVVDLDARNKLTRKEKTQDYAQICDLHLPKRHCILRICDRSYQFQHGIQFSAQQNGNTGGSQSTLRLRWNSLLQVLDQNLSDVPIATSFTSFAETALDHLDLVETFETHIDLFRKSSTNWDPAFQIYSGLVFLYPTH